MRGVHNEVRRREGAGRSGAMAGGQGTPGDGLTKEAAAGRARRPCPKPRKVRVKVVFTAAFAAGTHANP